MDSMMSIMDIIFLGAGIYVLYTWYLLKFKGEIKESILLPQGMQVKKCKDKAAYIAEMSPRVLFYGIVVTICGALGIVEGQWGLLGSFYYLVLLVFFAVTVWFSIQLKNSVKKYW